MAACNVHPAEEDFSYFCFHCRNTTEETEKDFFYVGALGPCYNRTLCGEEFEAGFKREEMKSSDTSSHHCNVCGKTFRERAKIRSSVASFVSALQSVAAPMSHLPQRLCYT
ncbi:hypothetical protein TNCT_487271 [Trichonephila clavata]|uniref:Uncharacterized protein n=1 Tax=Trichonephila clavata TaxID=2740835 RepID=A0A8X6LEW5_TRICU|nr:hypothetical protein TNCT_487271 [Trichonephila clavata]